MKALSLWQPWATLIAEGEKKFETRSWSTSYRGRLLIHAAKRWDAEISTTCYSPVFYEVLTGHGYLDAKDDQVFGGFIAIVHLSRICHVEDMQHLSTQERAFGNYAPGRFAWELRDVRKFKNPIYYRGALGLFDVPDQMIAEALSQL